MRGVAKSRGRWLELDVAMRRFFRSDAERRSGIPLAQRKASSGRDVKTSPDNQQFISQSHRP